MKKIVFLICIVLIQSAACADTFTVGVENINYYPFYKVLNGEYVGYARDLLDAFGKKHGYTFNYVPLPIIRLHESFLVRKNLDFKFPDNPNWSQAMRKDVRVIYSDPVVRVTEGLIVLAKNKNQEIGKIRHLGTVLGFTPWPYFDRINRGELVVTENDSFEHLLQQVRLGRVDAAYINVEVARWLLKNDEGTDPSLVFDESKPHTTSAFSLATIRYEKIIKEFNGFLISEKILIAKLRSKYRLDIQ